MDDQDFENNLGISRRTLMKRTAVVGAGVAWATPVVQSLAGPAFAQNGTPACILQIIVGTPPDCFVLFEGAAPPECCECVEGGGIGGCVAECAGADIQPVVPPRPVPCP
jgi:hypothetical protein